MTTTNLNNFKLDHEEVIKAKRIYCFEGEPLIEITIVNSEYNFYTTKQVLAFKIKTKTGFVYERALVERECRNSVTKEMKKDCLHRAFTFFKNSFLKQVDDVEDVYIVNS